MSPNKVNDVHLGLEPPARTSNPPQSPSLLTGGLRVGDQLTGGHRSYSYVIQEYLGSGCFSHVYKVHRQEHHLATPPPSLPLPPPLVLKTFNELGGEDYTSWEQEREVLDRLNQVG